LQRVYVQRMVEKHRSLRERSLLAFAVEIGMTDDTPTTGVRGIKAKSDGHRPWSEQHIAEYEARYPVRRVRSGIGLFLSRPFSALTRDACSWRPAPHPGAPGIKHVTVTSVSFSSLRKGEREGINKRLGTVIDRLEGDTPLL
jgi:hypothetical protein